MLFQSDGSSVSRDVQSGSFVDMRSRNGTFLTTWRLELHQRLPNGQSRVGQNHLTPNHLLIIDNQRRLEIAGAVFRGWSDNANDESQMRFGGGDSDGLPFP